jgi:hypothetical protein
MTQAVLRWGRIFAFILGAQIQQFLTSSGLQDDSQASKMLHAGTLSCSLCRFAWSSGDIAAPRGTAGYTGWSFCGAQAFFGTHGDSEGSSGPPRVSCSCLFRVR